jgi:hypothetical protein
LTSQHRIGVLAALVLPYHSWTPRLSRICTNNSPPSPQWPFRNYVLSSSAILALDKVNIRIYGFIEQEDGDGCFEDKAQISVSIFP